MYYPLHFLSITYLFLSQQLTAIPPLSLESVCADYVYWGKKPAPEFNFAIPFTTAASLLNCV